MSDRATYDALIRHNRRASRLLIAGSVTVVAVIVWVAAGLFGLPVLDPAAGVAITAIGTAIGLALVFAASSAGPKVALKAVNAKKLAREDAPDLYRLYDEVCVAAGVLGRAPELYLVVDPAPNAFATGMRRDNAAIAVTTGLIDTLPRYELRAVLAHELAHVLNDDVRTVTLAVATAGLVALLADILVRYMWLGGRQRSSNNNNAAQLLFVAIGLLAVIIAPLVARLIRYAVARQREYLADATAAELLRDPQSMVNALRRIDENPTVLMKFDVATAHLWFEEPNAIDGETKAAKFARRFATHPSIRQRIERLATLNAGMVSLDQPLAPHQPKQANTDPRDDDPPPPPPSPFSPFDPLFPRGSS